MDILKDEDIKLKGVLFDFNGVLLPDSELQEMTWKKLSYKIKGIDYNIKYLRNVIHGRGTTDLIKLLIDSNIKDGDIQNIMNLKEEMYRELCLSNKELFKLTPGAIELFERLEFYNIPFTIASSASEADMRFYFEHLNLNKWFNWNKIAYFDGKVKTKPAPDLYILGAKKLNLDPTECCVIEDAVAGMQAAKNANAGFIVAVSIERELPAEAKDLANIVIYSLDELNDDFIKEYFGIKEMVDFPLYYIAGIGY
ncbi:MAG: HAD family phosphatase [Deferribacterota bacterium]|nr:HAD family phosphatase [Deferribacterota bacterium]